MSYLFPESSNLDLKDPIEFADMTSFGKLLQLLITHCVKKFAQVFSLLCDLNNFIWWPQVLVTKIWVATS